MSKSEMIITILCAIFSSVGFWTFVNNVYQDRREKKSVERKALLGLLHEKVMERATYFISKGSMTRSEHEDFLRYVYEPYVALGGNGTGETLKKQVDELKIIG